MNLSAEPFIKMPKACISCVHYQPVGHDQDEHCPFPGQFASSPKKTRTPYGACKIHRSEAFATEICRSYECDPAVMPVTVENRPVPREAKQELLLWGEA